MYAPIAQQREPQFSLLELEQVELAIRATSDCLAALHVRRNALTAELERLTRPAPRSTLTPAPTLTGRGVEYRGEAFPLSTYIDIYMTVLRRLWGDFPDRRDEIAKSVGRCGTARAYIARSRDPLFPGQSPEFALRYSKPLADGWYVDTNLNQERMARLLPVAVQAAGLTWGKDVRVRWRSDKANANPGKSLAHTMAGGPCK